VCELACEPPGSAAPPGAGPMPDPNARAACEPREGSGPRPAARSRLTFGHSALGGTADSSSTGALRSGEGTDAPSGRSNATRTAPVSPMQARVVWRIVNGCERPGANFGADKDLGAQREMRAANTRAPGNQALAADRCPCDMAISYAASGRAASTPQTGVVAGGVREWPGARRGNAASALSRSGLGSFVGKHRIG
jgi:hypothetical protein